MNRLTRNLLASLVLLFLLPACSWLRPDFKDPDIRVLGFTHLRSSNLLDQRFALQLQLTNPNDLQLDVKGLTFTFNIDDVELMHGVSNQVPRIMPYSQTNFTVDGSANLVEAVQLLKKLQRHPERKVHYKLQMQVELAHGWPSRFNVVREGETGLDTALDH